MAPENKASGPREQGKEALARTITDRANMLGSLQTFDSNAFRGDGEVPQQLCDLILAFALVFNDCRDLLFWLDGLVEIAPKEIKITRFFGEHGGSMTHAFRLVSALVHELGELINTNGRWLHDPFFERKVLSKLDKSQRETWSRVVNLAHGKSTQKPIDQFLKFLRDKSAYHYDAGQLRAPYDRRFPPNPSEDLKKPFVSRGNRVRSNRFYFADALGFDLIEQEAVNRGLMPLGKTMESVLTDVAAGLASVVEAFIQVRSARFP